MTGELSFQQGVRDGLLVLAGLAVGWVADLPSEAVAYYVLLTVVLAVAQYARARLWTHPDAGGGPA